MGVRNHVPSSIAFVVIVCSGGKRLRVEVLLDLQERFLFVPAKLLPIVRNRIPFFVEKMGAIASNLLAIQKWDGDDPITEYQPIFLLKGYRVADNRMRFNVLLGEPNLLQVSKLDQRSEVQLDEA
ncbi:hypothetical protein H6F67_03960 [Microcoleus sp. FACHB-1515]|uniref:hypothetical protein n=1 Tax=Cyanophyceae TaxID=3028117 RepID=UPI0016825D69|nr:hypothetical protein [Microcoleus sp. FACHB-1515]MBD2089008.1 hypothetical protein [Microcoleus sp. FACHB-1515]